MLENIRQISVFNKIFNLKGGEWARVTFSWLIRFFYRAGFVVGWTIIVALFVSRYGILALPYLFVLNGVFSMIGTFFYSFLLEKFKKTYLICGTVILTVITLFAALYLSQNELLFFSLLLFCEAVFLVQLKVLIDGYIEEMFSPLESERTFPVIESSETIGGIIAGFIVVNFSSVIETSDFIYFWAGTLLLVIPLILIYKTFFGDNIPFVKKHFEEKDKGNFLKKIRKEFANSKHWSFIKGLILIVFFHWFLFNLLEFQYTRAVYQNVSHVVLDAGSGFEHAFVHDLGQLFMLFSGSALLVQLFVGSRLINSLGVTGSMLIHPIVTLLSLLGLSFSYNYTTAVLAKNNYTITGIIFTNVYHSSYYAIKEKFREHAREFIEGIVRPLGAILGTFSIILMQRFVSSERLILAVNISMVVVAGILFLITYFQQNKYTGVAVDDLLNSKNKEERINAIDILAQKGHSSSINNLRMILLNENESIAIRIAILKAFAELQNSEVIEDILKCLNSPNQIIREHALSSLLFFRFLGKSLKKCLFLEYELVSTLKKLYGEENKDLIRSQIIQLLSKLSPVAAYSFLLDIIELGKGNLKTNAILALRNYEDENIAVILKPFLNSKNPKYKISAAIALGNFEQYKDDASYIIYSFLYSDDKNLISQGLFALGELKWIKQKNICLKYLDSSVLILRIHSAIALAKMGIRESIAVIIDLLFSLKGESLKEFQNMLKNVDVRIYKNIDKIVKHLVAMELQHTEIAKDLEKLDNGDLVSMQRLFCLIGEYDEVKNIDNILNKYFKT